MTIKLNDSNNININQRHAVHTTQRMNIQLTQLNLAGNNDINSNKSMTFGPMLGTPMEIFAFTQNTTQVSHGVFFLVLVC